MAFKRGRNANLYIQRRGNAGVVTRIYPATGTVECFIGPPSGPKGIMDFIPSGDGPAASNDPTGVILFDVPKTYPTEIVVRSGDEFVVSGSDAQTNGVHALIGRANNTPNLNSTKPTYFRCYVQKVPNS